MQKHNGSPVIDWEGRYIERVSVVVGRKYEMLTETPPSNGCGRGESFACLLDLLKQEIDQRTKKTTTATTLKNERSR